MGPLAASMAFAGWSSRTWQMPSGARSFSQVALGLAVGLNLDLGAIGTVGGQVIALMVMVAFTVGLSMLNGYLLWRWTGVDRAAGFLGSVPGAATAMVVMSADMGVDPRLVAIIQHLRVLGVAVIVPFMVEKLFPRLPAHWLGAEADLLQAAGAVSSGPVPPADGMASAFSLGDGALLLLFAVAGLIAGRRLRLPSYAFLGPCFAAAAGSYAFGVSLSMPAPLFNFSLVLLGTWIGLLFDLPMIRRIGPLAVLNVILVVFMLAVSLVATWVFSQVTGIPLLTAFLANAPGAMEVIVAASIKMGADTPLVVSVQMLRFVLLLLWGPQLARRLAGEPAMPAAEQEARSR